MPKGESISFSAVHPAKNCQGQVTRSATSEAARSDVTDLNERMKTVLDNLLDMIAS